MEAQCFQQLNMKILESELHQGVQLFNYLMKTMQVTRVTIAHTLIWDYIYQQRANECLSGYVIIEKIFYVIHIPI